MRVAPRVELSPEERVRLVRWRDAPNVDRTRARHARLILLAADGRTDLEIAASLRLNRRTVGRWRRRFLSLRLHGLEESLAPVRSGRIAEERLQRIVRATLGPPAEAGSRGWSTRRLAREYGVSHMTVRRLWDLYGIRPTGPWRVRGAADPVGPVAPWDIVALQLRPPGAVMVATLRPRLPSGTVVDRLPASRGAEIISPPTRDARLMPAFRSLSVAPDPAGAPAWESYRRVLGAAAQRIGEGIPAHVLAVVDRSARPEPIERWQVRHPGIQVERVPDLEQWRLRAAEILSAAGRRDVPRRHRHGPAETVRSLTRFLSEYRAQSGPFEWIATRAEVAEGEAAYRLRYELAGTGHPGFRERADGQASAPPIPDSGEEGRAMARLVLRRCLGVRPRERVTIESWSETISYANAFVFETLRIGAIPLLLYQDEPTYWAATAELPARSLAPIGGHRRTALESTDALVSFFGPSDRERLHSLPSATMAQVGEFQDASFRAAARGRARTVQMAIGRISHASARMYGVDEERWRSELLSASRIDPTSLRRRGERLVRALSRGRTLEIDHPNGTRIALRLRGYRPVLTDGRVRPASETNPWEIVTLPAGVVSVAVDERYAEGSFRSNHPSSIGLSDSVGAMAGGTWRFRAGRLVEFRYELGEELFAQSYGRAREGRDRPASVSIGLNEHLHAAPLLEDQGLGTITLHIGRSEHLGGRTRVPWWAWSFLDGGSLSVDGRQLVRDGRLLER